ncbi:nitrilase-related carbon-nitrogen hydrolase [Dictyobacter arantiisoli]|uniref:Amidohydrolase n=1 Tax=Dictyobacter arantiisoli TaxID=2014874 RepID=A0A5A5TKZ8_9CHLR|nr:nitrilase-related carbon-nitrogen hydrolase [Dictyobacter arantiisoli]GCF11614.1 amidohydrolase [Dictyobacter arantiisoli]
MSSLFTHEPQFSTYRVAAIQYEPTLGEKEKNILNLLQLVEDAVAHGARLIVLPEMATTGNCWISNDEIAPYVESIPGPTTERFLAVAQMHQCYIALGLPEVDSETQLYYNSVVLLGPAGIIGTYRKIHLDIGDPRWASEGDQGFPVWDTPLGRISALVGSDAKYFEAARIAALHGADVLLYLANWAEETFPISWWMARAFENKVFVVAANRDGRERGIQFHGGSCVLNPDGSMQTFLEHGVGIAYGEVDVQQSRDKRWLHQSETVGLPLADRSPGNYRPLLQNSYLWEPLRYHSLYELGELPTGQLSCTGIVQIDLSFLPAVPQHSAAERIQALLDWLRSLMRDNAPAVPDVLVLPELVLPGSVPPQIVTQNDLTALAAHFRAGAIQVPGPETDMLVALANELQVSLVLGVAERNESNYYNTVLLIDPEGVYGIYRKIHLSPHDRLWATPGNLGFPTFDTPAGRIGLATGYDVLFPETLRILANKGTDLVCAPALLDYPVPIALSISQAPMGLLNNFDTDNPFHFLIWRTRAAEHNVYLAVANWFGTQHGVQANGMSGIFSPGGNSYALPEVIADEDEEGLMMMTIDTREQRTGRRTTRMLDYSPGDMAGSLTGELAYNILDSIPGNLVRSKPMLRKRQLFWYMDLVRKYGDTAE